MTTVVVATEHHFARDDQSRIYSTTGGREYRYWQRYLEVFDKVVIVGRAGPTMRDYATEERSDGPRVDFVTLPDFYGPYQFLRYRHQIVRLMSGIAAHHHSYILRLPGTVGSMLGHVLNRRSQPYALELVGDPYDVLAPGVIHSRLRPILRVHQTRQLAMFCDRAAAVLYVTDVTLQRRYPAGTNAYTVAVSDVDLSEAGFVHERKHTFGNNRSTHLVTVGSLQQIYKGTDVLLDAIALLAVRGQCVSLDIVGDGQYRPMLEQRVEDLGIQDRVAFVGQLPAGQAVRNEMDQADLFVLPSRTEGLPRAMIEAMARGLPCIGSAVGGIPELLPAEDLVPPGDARTLADKIAEVISDPARMAHMGARNLERAREYHQDVLRARRIAFYEHVRERTEEWFNGTNG